MIILLSTLRIHKHLINGSTYKSSLFFVPRIFFLKHTLLFHVSFTPWCIWQFRLLLLSLIPGTSVCDDCNDFGSPCNGVCGSERMSLALSTATMTLAKIMTWGWFGSLWWRISTTADNNAKCVSKCTKARVGKMSKKCSKEWLALNYKMLKSDSVLDRYYIPFNRFFHDSRCKKYLTLIKFFLVLYIAVLLRKNISVLPTFFFLFPGSRTVPELVLTFLSARPS